MADEKVITSEVESSPETVNTVRAEMPSGAGVPIDRLPYQEGLAALATSGVTSKRIASTERCIRVIEIPQRGGGAVKCHCSRACVSVGNMNLCPDHDKAAFAPQQTPVAKGRVISSADIPLTKSEQDDLAKVSKVFAEHGENTPSRVPAQTSTGYQLHQAERNTMKDAAQPAHDLKVYFTLEALDSGDIRETVAAALCDALDNLPAGNVRQMKRIVALQEKLQKTFLNPKGGKKHARRSAKTQPAAETL